MNFIVLYKYNKKKGLKFFIRQIKCNVMDINAYY